MKVGLLINEFESLVGTQTTAMMAHTLAHMGCVPLVFGVADLSTDVRGRPVAQARRGTRAATPDAVVEQLRARPSEPLPLAELDAILVRTNPARDARAWAHESALQLLARVARDGTWVTNDPAGLYHTGSKLFLAELPCWASPRTVISHSRDDLRAFVRSSESPSVLKPIKGTRGMGVFKVEPDSPNLNALLDVLLERGLVMAQEFVPEAVDGDTRVIVLDGQVLRCDGDAAAVRRRPGQAEFRSNIHAGGTATLGVVTPEMQRVIDAVGPLLLAHGIRLAGLDFIGARVCEVNVFSTGGFRDAERFTGHPFLRRALEVLLEVGA